jgi:hypothetical protein
MAACEGKDQSVRDWLGNTGPGSLYEWHKRVSDAVCQLEEKAQVTTPLTNSRRICPNGSGGSGDKTTPPKYP